MRSGRISVAARWRRRRAAAGDGVVTAVLRLFDGHPWWALFCSLAALAVVIDFWWFAAAVAVTYCWCKSWGHYRAHLVQKEARATVLAARADWENQQFIAGNSIGWYGQYPPVR